MFMDNNEVTYIPYGLDEISQQELMTNLANGIPEYLSSKRWALKPKNLKAWMAAYLDIIGKGLAGASNSSGVWKVNTNNTIDLDSMSDKDREIYQDAAYYIQQQMAKMTPRKKKEEEKKKDLKTFNFSESFKLLLLNNYYGGDEKLFLDPEEGWNSLDAMDEKAGVRGIEKRKERVLSELLKYLLNFKDDDYTFEGTSFTDAADARAKIQKAIDALNSSDTTDDAPAFNALGIQFRGLFSNGANEVSKYTKNGLPLTWKEYADYLKTEEQNKIKAELDKVKAQRANQYDNYKYYNFLNGTPSNAQDFEGIVSKLSNQLALDGNDISRISWAFRQAEKSGGLTNLTKEELSRFGSRYAEIPNRLKKLPGLEGIYYDSIGKRLIQPQKGLLQGTDLLSILYLNSPEALLLKQSTAPRQLSDGLKYEDYARIGAALGDVISLGGFWANVGGSIVSLIGDTSADIADDKVSTWEAVKNFGKNLGWTAAGFIPGGKLGKVSEHMLRWGPKLLVALNDYNLLNDESNKKTWNKLTSDRLIKEGLNDEDLKNITYWVRALTGTANAVKATGRDIKYSKARGTAGLKFKTKDGTEVLLSNKAVAEINVTGAKRGLKAAEAKFKEKVKEATGQEHEVADGTFKFSENGRKYFSNTRSKVQDSRLQGESVVFRTPEQQRYYDLLLQDRSLGGFGGWRPFWLRGTSSYFDRFDKGNFKNPLNGILRKVDPYKNMINSLHQNNPLLIQQNLHLNQNKTREIPDNFKATGKAPTSPKHNMTRNEWKKANKKLYKDIDKKGRFTNLMPEEGTYEFKDPTGNTHTFKLILRDDDFLLDIKSSNGVSKLAVLTLDLVKKGIWDNIKLSLNTGLRNDISLPANIIRALLGSAYGWLKEGGTIDKQKIQLYKKITNK